MSIRGKAVPALIAIVLLTAACASNGSGAKPGGGTDAAVVTAATTAVNQHLAVPTKILETDTFTPNSGDLIYNISCNLAIVGCGEISGEIGKAVGAIGDRFQRCNAGATPSQAQGCFTNAVNAKAKVIVDNDVPLVGSGSGYSQAAAANIPIVGAFTGNPLDTAGEPTQAAEDAPTVEAQLLADYVISKSAGKAHVLYIGQNQDNDGVLRGKAFDDEMKKCTGCKVKDIQVNVNTQVTSGPPQITAALQSSPDIDWIIGNNDGVSVSAVTVLGQLGRTSQVKVGGMDANPQNIQYLKENKQAVDVTVGQGEVAWAAVYAAAAVAAGHTVPKATPVNIWLIDSSNISSVPASGVFFGPAGYEQQFLALMGK